MLDLSAVHRCRGLWVSYVLKCEGDEEAPYYIYVGVSQDVELRMLAHTGIREFEQAEFTKNIPSSTCSVCGCIPMSKKPWSPK